MSAHEVEAVWIIKYSISHFKALYGRRMDGAVQQGYTKDYLQISGECEKELFRVIGRELADHDMERVEYSWPGGSLPGQLRRPPTSGRINLNWPTHGHPPQPWRMAHSIGSHSLETFEGNPDLKTALEANREWQRFSALDQDPWLVIVKLKDEDSVFHVRAYLGNPPQHLQHCSTRQLPDPIRTVMTPSGNACRVVSMSSNASGGGPSKSRRLWFDPSRNHDAFLPDTFAPVESEDEVEGDVNADEITVELGSLEEQLEHEPQLTEGLELEDRQLRIRPRSAAFRVAVRRGYEYRCAVCESSLRGPTGTPEAEAAHIYPKKHDGSDDPRNGLCLCRQHHWALDQGWMSVSDDLKVMVHPLTSGHKSRRGVAAEHRGDAGR